MKAKKREEAHAAADKQGDTTQTTKQSPRKKKGRGRKRKADESFQLSDFMDKKVALDPSLLSHLVKHEVDGASNVQVNEIHFCI